MIFIYYCIGALVLSFLIERIQRNADIKRLTEIVRFVEERIYSLESKVIALELTEKSRDYLLQWLRHDIKNRMENEESRNEIQNY